MDLPPIDSPITLLVRQVATGQRFHVAAKVRAAERIADGIMITAEVIEGPEDGQIVCVRLLPTGLPDEAPGFPESDDAGEDWKHQP